MLPLPALTLLSLAPLAVAIALRVGPSPAPPDSGFLGRCRAEGLPGGECRAMAGNMAVLLRQEALRTTAGAVLPDAACPGSQARGGRPW